MGAPVHVHMLHMPKSGPAAMPIYAYRHSMGHIKNSPQETVGANRPKNGKHVQLC